MILLERITDLCVTHCTSDMTDVCLFVLSQGDYMALWRLLAHSLFASPSHVLYVQTHAAWLEEPQEMTTFDAGKEEPLLKGVADSDSQEKQGMLYEAAEPSLQQSDVRLPAGKVVDSKEEPQANELGKLNEV